MKKRTGITLFLCAFLISVSPHDSYGKKNSPHIETFLLKIFNKNLVENVKNFFYKKSENGILNWSKKHPGTIILGASTTCMCLWRQYRLPFYSSLAGIGVGSVLYFGNKEYMGTPLQRPIESINKFFNSKKLR